MTQPQRCDIDTSGGWRRAKGTTRGLSGRGSTVRRAYACMSRGIPRVLARDNTGYLQRVRSWMVWWRQRDELIVTCCRYDAPLRLRRSLARSCLLVRVPSTAARSPSVAQEPVGVQVTILVAFDLF